MLANATNTSRSSGLAIAYLLLQGALIIAFWAALFIFPDWRPAFVKQGTPWDLFLAFALPDVLILVTSSWLGAWALASRSRWTLHILWLNAGAAGYAALCAFALLLTDQTLWLGAAMMSPLLVIPGFLAASRSGPNQ